jgi:hypothetical protein
MGGAGVVAISDDDINDVCILDYLLVSKCVVLDGLVLHGSVVVRTYQKADDVLRVPKIRKDAIPDACSARIIPAVDTSYLHEPRLPGLGSHHQAFNMSSQSHGVKGHF